MNTQPTLNHTVKENTCHRAAVNLLNMAAMDQAADNANAPLFAQVQFYIVQSKGIATDVEKDVIALQSFFLYIC